MPLSIKARRQQGLSEISRLCDEFDSWQQEIKLPQYATQLESIASEVLACAGRLRSALEDLAAPLALGAGYARCSRIEKQIAWLWRAWDYFRAKFDQRRNDRFADTLRAADEVVWSCYRPFFRQPFDQRIPDPAPLPYIEMEYSPVAVRSDQGAVIDGRPAQHELLAAAFQKLPVPVLKLPISAVHNPWAIALTGHETGHFVQRMISENPLQFVGEFRSAIENAAGDAEWGSWAVEIFADWFSVLTMGQWSLHPIAQFGSGTVEDNVKPGGVYPPPLIRLQLMATLADLYSLPGSGALKSIALDAPEPGKLPDYEKNLAAVGNVALAIANLPDCRSVAERFDPRPENYGEGGLASQWAKYIGSGGGQPPVAKPDSARLVAAGAVQVWDQLIFTPPEPPDEAVIDELRQRARRAMKDAAMLGTRSASASVTPPDQSPGDVLFAALEEIAGT
jgi:hypothetical protein